MADAPSLTARLIAEFVGTFLLVFTVGCNVLIGNKVWGVVSIACVLMVSIYALGGISGANFNPAVSLTLGLVKSLGGKGIGLEWKEVAAYICTQIAAGIFAALCYGGLFWDVFNLAPGKTFTWLHAGMAEILYTFMLCFVVLNVAVAKKATPNQYYGLAIGFVIVAGGYAVGPISGACLNPAVAIGIDTSSAGLGFGWCLAYTCYEFIGAALAALLFMVVRPEEFKEDADEEPTNAAKMVSEFLGTFMLVLTVGLNVLDASPAGAFSIAASLMCMIYALGGVSGAHFNPAVTIAILCSRMSDLTVTEAIKYIGVQILGGIAAAFTYSSMHKFDAFPLGPIGKYQWHQVAIAEIIFTFVLCFVVLSVAVATKKTHSDHMYGLAIGSCVTVGGVAIGSISGGSLNPAVSCGIAAADLLKGGLFWQALVYSAFEIIGGVMAAGVFNVTHEIEKRSGKLEDDKA